MKKTNRQTIYDNYDDEYDELDWDFTKNELKNFFDNGSTWLLRGQNERWTGTHEAGTIFRDFMKMFLTITKDCDYYRIYDENGHFHIECSHHDGTNRYEIRKLTNRGTTYLENWEDNFNDKRSEHYIHDKLMKPPYSVLPQYARNIYGYTPSKSK